MPFLFQYFPSSYVRVLKRTEEEFCVEIRLFVLIMSAPAVALCPQAIRPRLAVSTQNSSPGYFIFVSQQIKQILTMHGQELYVHVQRFRVRHGLSCVIGPVWPVGAGCYSQAALPMPLSKPLYQSTSLKLSLLPLSVSRSGSPTKMLAFSGHCIVLRSGNP